MQTSSERQVVYLQYDSDRPIDRQCISLLVRPGSSGRRYFSNLYMGQTDFFLLLVCNEAFFTATAASTCWHLHLLYLDLLHWIWPPNETSDQVDCHVPHTWGMVTTVIKYLYQF